MKLTPQFAISYGDFLAIVNSIGAIRAVYYFDDTSIGNNFSITVLMADGHIGIQQNFNIGTPPVTFATDFPAAIAIPGIVAVS